MSLTTLVVQTLAAAVIAALVTWSIFQGSRYVYPNNSWLDILSLLPTKLNVGIRAFLTFEAMFSLGDLLFFLLQLIRRLYLYAIDTIGLQSTQVGMGVLVILGGLVAYRFKTKNQVIYGLVEIIFAGALGVATAKQITPTTQPTGVVAAIIGAIYVVSRGVGNIADGWKKSSAR